MNGSSPKRLLALAAASVVLAFGAVIFFGDMRLDAANDRFFPRLSETELGSEYAESFESSLPVIYIRAEDKAALTNPDYDLNLIREEVDCQMLVFDAESNRLDSSPSESYLNVRLKIRGRYSAGQAKRPYAIELRDESGKPIDYPLLGLDAESDFVLHAPYIDKSTLRNYIAYTLAGELYPNAPDCKLVEVFITEGDEPVSEVDYYGIYLLCEKIKAGESIVPVTEYVVASYDDIETQMEKGGGYIIRRDKYDEGRDNTTQLPYTMQMFLYQIFFPKPEDLSSREIDLIYQELQFMENILTYSSYENVEKYYDIDSVISILLVNELAWNSEAMEGSYYFYRPVGGKYTAGPLWDVDVSMGNNSISQLDESTNDEKRVVQSFLQRPEIMEQFCLRWAQERTPGGLFCDESINKLIDDAVSLMGDALQRNADRFPELFDGETDIFANIYHNTSYTQEIEQLRTFLLERAAWMDERYAND